MPSLPGYCFDEAVDELGGRSNDEQDALGGSGAKPADNSKPVSVPQPALSPLATDAARWIPRFFEEYSEIHTLAVRSRDMRSLIVNTMFWKGWHLRLDVPELKNNGEALRNAAALFRKAATLTLDIVQVPLLDRRPTRALINWNVKELFTRKPEARGWISTNPLLGAVRLALRLNQSTQTIYIGAIEAQLETVRPACGLTTRTLVVQGSGFQGCKK